MKLTTKGRYAVTAMLDLALHSVTNPITLSDISSRQGLSLSYLEQLFSRLRRNGLVASTRGPGGGYQLGRSPELIKVAEVILAVNEPIDATGCKGKRSCQDGNVCLAHDLWLDLSDEIYNYLNNITLADVISRQSLREIAYKQDAPISNENNIIDIQLPQDASGLSKEVSI